MLIKAFATFGSSQLVGFNINPMRVAVVIDGATEDELRARLKEEPFNNKYCTTYPERMLEDMKEKYGMVTLTVDELIGDYYES